MQWCPACWVARAWSACACAQWTSQRFWHGCARCAPSTPQPLLASPTHPLRTSPPTPSPPPPLRTSPTHAALLAPCPLRCHPRALGPKHPPTHPPTHPPQPPSSLCCRLTLPPRCAPSLPPLQVQPMSRETDDAFRKWADKTPARAAIAAASSDGGGGASARRATCTLQSTLRAHQRWPQTRPCAGQCPHHFHRAHCKHTADTGKLPPECSHTLPLLAGSQVTRTAGRAVWLAQCCPNP
jgi:hypothetical protein